ncbi:MAG: alpha-amylase family glycosyl hydrolase, partial [Candidatus Eremiobacterota bacterium]
GIGAGLLLSGGVVAAGIGGATGAVVGGLLGNFRKPLAYDAKAVGRWWKDLGTSLKGAVSHGLDAAARRLGRHVGREPLPALTLADLKGADSTGNMVRKYDGYDSSRDLFALYAREGKPDEAYAFQVEVAHLRGGAEGSHLDTHILLDWGDAGAPAPVPFGLHAPATPWKAAIRVEDNRNGDVVAPDGRSLGAPQQTYHSTTFNHVRFDVDKQALRDLGWTDGQPLRMTVLTSRDGDPEVADRLEGRTDAAPAADLLSKVFRWEGKVVYYAVTDRFHDGDKTNNQGVDPSEPEKFHGGDWQGIIDKLDYIQGLGADCVWISCPYLNDTNFFGKDGFHGYWPHDFEKPDPHFGDMARLQELVEKAHAKGMKVMLDVVVNHTGYNHPIVTDPAYQDWFHREGDIKWVGQYHMENAALAGLPDLDHSNPRVRRYLIDVHKMWIDQTDLDAFRMDAVRHVPEDYLREFDQEMHAAKPGYLSIGESFWLDPNFNAGYQSRTIDSVFDFPLAYAMRDVFASDEKRGFKERLQLAREFFWNNPQEAMRELLSPNGGSMRRLSLIMNQDHLFDNPKKLGTLVDNHDMIRFMSDCGGDTRKLEIALAFMMGARGMPCIYYGTEVATEGAAEGNRKDMEWGKNPQFTDRFRKLTAARNASPALQYGSQRELHVSRETYAFARMRPEEEVLCVFNNADEEREVSFGMHSESRIGPGAGLTDLVSGGTAAVGSDGRLTFRLPAKGYAFYQWKTP